jgi:hypothetical protein
MVEQNAFAALELSDRSYVIEQGRLTLTGRGSELLENTHELRGRPCVAPPLHKEIENFALVVDRPPEPESSAADQDSHLIEVPLRGWPMTSAAKFLGEQRPELQHPSPYRFIGDIQPALG